MTYMKTPIPNSANARCGLMFNNAAQVVWQGDTPTQIYLYQKTSGVTQKISDNPQESRRGVGCDINKDGIVVWDTFDTTSGRYAICRYEGTTSIIDTGGQRSCNPRINDNNAITFLSYDWNAPINDECTLIEYRNGIFNRLKGYQSGREYHIHELRLNNDGQIAYLLIYIPTHAWEVHLLKDGSDRILSVHPGEVGDIDINNNGWVVWDQEKPGGPRDIYLYDGSETKKINSDNNLLDAFHPRINDKGQIVYNVGVYNRGELTMGNYFKSDIYLYSQGSTKNLTPHVKYNLDPRINNNGEIVWWGGSQWKSPSTSNIYLSNTGSTAQEIATSGGYPLINGRGQIVYWDENARQLILLTPALTFSNRLHNWNLRFRKIRGT